MTEQTKKRVIEEDIGSGNRGQYRSEGDHHHADNHVQHKPERMLPPLPAKNAVQFFPGLRRVAEWAVVDDKTPGAGHRLEYTLQRVDAVFQLQVVVMACPKRSSHPCDNAVPASLKPGNRPPDPISGFRFERLDQIRRAERQVAIIAGGDEVEV